MSTIHPEGSLLPPEDNNSSASQDALFDVDALPTVAHSGQLGIEEGGERPEVREFDKTTLGEAAARGLIGNLPSDASSLSTKIFTSADAAPTSRTPEAKPSLFGTRGRKVTALAALGGAVVAGGLGMAIAKSGNSAPKSETVATSPVNTAAPSQQSTTEASIPTPTTIPSAPNITVGDPTPTETAATESTEPLEERPHATYETYAEVTAANPEDLIDDKGTLKPQDIVHIWFANLQRTINLADVDQQTELFKFLYEDGPERTGAISPIEGVAKDLRGFRDSFQLGTDKTPQEVLDEYTYVIIPRVMNITDVTPNSFSTSISTSEGVAIANNQPPTGQLEQYAIRYYGGTTTTFVRKKMKVTVGDTVGEHYVWQRGPGKDS